MKDLLSGISFRICEKLYLRDPDSTDLGKRIVQHSILMINEIGFEQFTFKKLAQRIKSTEASVYRYFENKHKLLIYLVNWYWNWVEYQMIFNTNNIENPKERLKIAIKILSQPVEEDPSFEHIDERVLHDIVVAESPKAYLTKHVDNDNREGYFQAFKRLNTWIADIIREINPKYPWPLALVSTIIESAHEQKFFSEHLPKLTEVPGGKEIKITEFLIDLTFKSIEK